MEGRFRQRYREEDADRGDEYDRKRDRKEKRRSDRLARKQARIEAHESWVEQRRLLKQSKHDARTTQRQDDKMLGKEKRIEPLSSNNAGQTAKKKKNNAINEQGRVDKIAVSKKDRVKEELAPKMSDANSAVPAKYVPPALRPKVKVEVNSTLDEVTRRIINKLTVRNVADLTREVSDYFSGTVPGVTRASVLHSLAQNINRMCMLDTGSLTPIVGLPFAGLIRGLQLLHGSVVGAELIESLCMAIQEHLEAGREMATSNGAMVLAYLYMVNAVDALLIADFLHILLRRGKGDEEKGVCAVASGLALLRACGEKLLKEAPHRMEKALAEAKAYHRTHSTSGRHTALLSFITDIVAGHTRRAKRTTAEEEVPLEAMLSDLASLLPGSANSGNSQRVLLRVVRTTSVLTGLTWERIVSHNKPPRWYAPGVYDDEPIEEDQPDNAMHSDNSDDGEDTDSDESTDDDTEDDETDLREARIRQMRQKEKAIAGQRINTESKREVFQCIADASDDLECYTLLMHRDPSFTRLHDTVAVLLQCCYQEKTYNPYYAQVFQRFCSAKASCKNTLQFAIWDLFKSIRVENVDVAGYLNLSCLIAYLMEEDVFTLGVLRGLDLDSTNKTIGLFTRILLLRLILQLDSAKLTELFFGGDGFHAHDVKIDTSVLRSNLEKVVNRYFLDDKEASKWLPQFYDVVASGTAFDVRGAGETHGSNAGDEAQLQSFLKRIRVVSKALKRGIS